jgi:hypothetical protein
MTADLRAATAQGQKMDASPLSKLVDESIGLWTLATERCDGRAQERARRNLADSQRTRQALMAELGSGAECARGQKDATSLQDLAQQAIRERRWMEAAMLYRKAETSWDVVSEKCEGDARRLAEERREQTVIDAHNAEFCAPLFEHAREASQALRRQSASLSISDRQTQSQVAETLWRDAQTQCQGPALDLARQNALALAKDRGTPWAPTTAAASATALVGAATTATAAATAANTAANTAATTATTATTAASAGVAMAASRATQAALTPANPASATAATAPAGPPIAQDLDIEAGGQRYTGRFVRDGALLTGNGRITFTNGDVYVGDLLNSQRHGQGEFVWASGQRYRGTWNRDIPQGQGTLTFANGNRYEGAVVQGVPHGAGQMTYATGDSFKGQFTQGRPQGQGEYKWANGQRYEGPWLNEQPNGEGVMVYANGNRYQGTLVQGVPNGQGKMTYASGDVYEGQLVNGVPHGQGSYHWKQGDRYTGHWEAGRKDGQGLLEWANGDRWEGLFDLDDQTETGTLTRKQP